MRPSQRQPSEIYPESLANPRHADESMIARNSVQIPLGTPTRFIEQVTRPSCSTTRSGLSGSLSGAAKSQLSSDGRYCVVVVLFVSHADRRNMESARKRMAMGRDEDEIFTPALLHDMERTDPTVRALLPRIMRRLAELEQDNPRQLETRFLRRVGLQGRP